jgi:predicted TIM-barrel fold metal-dependent hydrolase
MKNQLESNHSSQANAPSVGRRKFLGFSALAVGLSSLPGCASIRSIISPEKGAGLFIDAHTHIFNAEDLPIYGYVKEVLAKELEPGKTRSKFAKVLFYSVDKLIQWVARDSGKESDSLAKILKDNHKADLAKSLDLQTLEEENDNEIQTVLIPELTEQIKGDREANEEVVRELAALEESRSKTNKGLFCWPFSIYQNSKLGRYMRLVNRYRTWRYKNAARLIKTFEDSFPGARDGKGVDLFVVAQVDMDYWVNDPSRTSIQGQIDVTEKINRLYDGRLLPFVAFDPLRNILENGRPLKWVQSAIEDHGFIGVKMYPPMGFRALGNTSLDKVPGSWPPHLVDTDTMKIAGHVEESKDKIRGRVSPLDNLGYRLDKQLRALYKWCEDKHVPIMVHSNDSSASEKGYEERAAPKYWAKVLEEYPELRLNLGHFGGWDDVAANAPGSGYSKASRWSGEIVKMMADNPNLYADFSNFHAIHDDDKGEDIVAGIKALFGKKKGILKSRLLYGSDWFMSTARKGNDEYFSDANELLNDHMPEHRAAILGGNAVNFLGLRDEDGTAKRLRAYYGDKPPAWMQRLFTS